MLTSRRDQADECSPICHQCLCLQGGSQLPLPPGETLQNQQVGLAQVPTNYCLSLAPGVCEILCVPFKSEASNSPYCEAPAFKPCLPSKLNALWALLLGPGLLG